MFSYLTSCYLPVRSGRSLPIHSPHSPPVHLGVVAPLECAEIGNVVRIVRIQGSTVCLGQTYFFSHGFGFGVLGGGGSAWELGSRGGGGVEDQEGEEEKTHSSGG